MAEQRVGRDAGGGLYAEISQSDGASVNVNAPQLHVHVHINITTGGDPGALEIEAIEKQLDGFMSHFLAVLTRGRYGAPRVALESVAGNQVDEIHTDGFEGAVEILDRLGENEGGP